MFEEKIWPTFLQASQTMESQAAYFSDYVHPDVSSSPKKLGIVYLFFLY